MLNTRIEQVKEVLKKNSQDAIFILKKENIGYLTQLTIEDSVLMISRDTCLLFITPMYFAEFKSLSIPAEVKLVGTSNTFLSLQKIIKKTLLKNILVETSIPYSFFLSFQKKLVGVNLSPHAGIVEKMRMVKDENEIEKIKKAAEIASRGYNYLLSLIGENSSEKNIRDKFEFYLKNNLGAQKIPFDIIVASGEQSCYPHAQTTTNRIEKNSLVIVDWGVMQDDYCCDITRTFSVGKPTLEQKRVYYAVYDAQRKALDLTKEGIRSREINNIVMTLFKEKNLLKYYIHGLGHGVGREIHEMPRLSKKSNIALKENMVITIEPGLYVPGVGGVRIEDTIVIKKNGADVLTNVPKKLLQL